MGQEVSEQVAVSIVHLGSLAAHRSDSLLNRREMLVVLLLRPSAVYAVWLAVAVIGQ